MLLLNNSQNIYIIDRKGTSAKNASFSSVLYTYGYKYKAKLITFQSYVIVALLIALMLATVCWNV